MERFSFSKPAPPPSNFSGRTFYNIYKDSEFLRNNDNLNNILARSFGLKKKLAEKLPGKTIVVEGYLLEKNTPLIIKNSAKGSTVGDFEFTFYRLCGFVSAYVFENRHRLPVVTSSEAEVLGLKWDCTNEAKCRLYLSAVSGSQDFYEQFLYYPLICALRKLQLKKTTPQSVVIIGNLKNANGETMAQLMMKNYKEVSRLWLMFPGNNPFDLKVMLAIAPPCIKRLFYG